MEAEPLMNIPTIARLLNVSSRTIHRLIHSRKISAVRIGGQWRFEKKAIEEIIAKNKNNAKRRRGKK